jgi:hypothetical protein
MVLYILMGNNDAPTVRQQDATHRCVVKTGRVPFVCVFSVVPTQSADAWHKSRV